ncbi:hypothetical protein AYI69_g8770 [Smittium culicis]|uniref:Uncharacterized protein n=1 Tax=Smittium culicis TaxID=133412 RepID=A0A1R1XH88_9FUNG|nr:hypothetical protein AYI69_g8770 [Smittium culicis]
MDGPKIHILEKVVLNIKFEIEIVFPIEFILLKKCAVSIILGRYACQLLKSAVDYKDVIWTFSCEGRKIKKQLYNKNEVSEQLISDISESTESDSSDYYEKSGKTSDSDDGNEALFLEVLNYEIIKSSNTEDFIIKRESDLKIEPETFEEKLINIISDFDEIDINTKGRFYHLMMENKDLISIK